MSKLLTTDDHDRKVAGLKYIYPVVSRRSGGLSVGINLSTNNACNWRCIYCQVPGLKTGNSPQPDFGLLAREFRTFLSEILYGDFFQHFEIEAGPRAIKDIAISGNGEPTSVKEFDRAIGLVGSIANEFGIFPHSKFVLISNGSLLHRIRVQAGLAELARHNGELWFKLDSATEQGRQLINNNCQSQKRLLKNLKIACSLCTTKLQTCILHYRGLIWSDQEKHAYLRFLMMLRNDGIHLQEIMLYSIARPSLQPEAKELDKAGIVEMAQFAAEIEALGYTVSLSC